MQNKVQARVISLRYTIYHENTAVVEKCANRGHAETQAEGDRKTELAGDVGSLQCTEGIATGSTNTRKTRITERTLRYDTLQTVYHERIYAFSSPYGTFTKINTTWRTQKISKHI